MLNIAYWTVNIPTETSRRKNGKPSGFPFRTLAIYALLDDFININSSFIDLVIFLDFFGIQDLIDRDWWFYN